VEIWSEPHGVCLPYEYYHYTDEPHDRNYDDDWAANFDNKYHKHYWSYDHMIYNNDHGNNFFDATSMEVSRCWQNRVCASPNVNV
jgi:hypothetical protein